MSKQLSRWAQPAPDTHCANCGTGIFTEVNFSELHKLAYSSMLDNGESFDLCCMCTQLESELIAQSQTRVHPARLTHYNKMYRS